MKIRLRPLRNAILAGSMAAVAALAAQFGAEAGGASAAAVPGSGSAALPA